MPKTLLATGYLFMLGRVVLWVGVVRLPNSRCTSTSATRTTEPSALAKPALMVPAIVPSADASVVGIHRVPVCREASKRSPTSGLDRLEPRMSAPCSVAAGCAACRTGPAGYGQCAQADHLVVQLDHPGHDRVERRRDLAGAQLGHIVVQPGESDRCREFGAWPARPPPPRSRRPGRRARSAPRGCRLAR